MRNRIRELRERARLTQRELAVLLNVNESDLSRWEAGRRPLSPAVIEKIAGVFKVGSWELFMDRKGLRRLVGGPDVMPASENQTRRTAKADASDTHAEKEDDAR